MMLVLLYVLVGLGCGLVLGVLIGASGRTEPWPMRTDPGFNWGPRYHCPDCGTETVP